MRLLLSAAIVLLAVTVIAFATPAKVGNEPVVVELFTSQGCSSCPSADALLAKINRDPALRGKVIPLAFHVDYWDSLGWRDPFSSRLWTQRQAAYVRTFKLNGAYTPQAVVDGRRELVGSNSFGLDAAIEAESRRKRDARVSVRIDGDGIVINSDAQRDFDLIVAVFENGIRTNVERGENEGKTLVNDAVVRELHRLGGAGRGANEKRLAIKLRPSMGVAALLQERETLRIEAAALALR